MEALLDLRDGMSHAQLMAKHGLTRRGLMSLLIKLQEVREAHGISDIDLDRLRTVERRARKTDALSSSRKDTEFSGNINNIDILEIFQFLVITGRRVVLAVSSQKGERGFIFIDRGMVKHAQCDQLKGEDALFRCLSFDGGSFANLPWREPDAVTINRPGEFMLVEAALKRDDAREGSSPYPPFTNSSPGEFRVAYK